jgi:septal ring factor EnvC (AmiA/AmiB activator)
MSTKKIKKIEELVSSVLQCLDSLYSKNRILEQKVQELEKEKKTLSKENEMVRDSLEKLKQLEVSHRMLEKERSAVRIKVKNVLQKIEKMDFV